MVILLLYSKVDNEKNTLGFPPISKTTPDRAQPGLHKEPIKVSIGPLFAPYCHGASAMVIDGSNTTNTIKNF